jgi:hypothetical protein
MPSRKSRAASARSRSMHWRDALAPAPPARPMHQGHQGARRRWRRTDRCRDGELAQCDTRRCPDAPGSGGRRDSARRSSAKVARGGVSTLRMRRPARASRMVSRSPLQLARQPLAPAAAGASASSPRVVATCSLGVTQALAAEVAQDAFQSALTVERARAAEQFVTDDAQRVDVGRDADIVPAQLLRCRITRRQRAHAGGG